MKTQIAPCAVLIAMLAGAAPALAGNLTPDAPYAQFKGKDEALFNAALYGMLDEGADGASRTWSNPDTKASGEVKAIKTFTRGETACRTVSIANKAGGRTASGKYNFCKAPTGKWALAQ
jgi:surface antigen